MTNPTHDTLINQCETYATTCTNRLAELDQAGREAFNGDYIGWNELMSAYTRAANDYRHAARYLRNGDTNSYTLVISNATSAHGSAVYYDETITGVQPAPAPRRRAMNLPTT